MSEDATPDRLDPSVRAVEVGGERHVHLCEVATFHGPDSLARAWAYLDQQRHTKNESED